MPPDTGLKNAELQKSFALAQTDAKASKGVQLIIKSLKPVRQAVALLHDAGVPVSMDVRLNDARCPEPVREDMVCSHEIKQPSQMLANGDINLDGRFIDFCVVARYGGAFVHLYSGGKRIEPDIHMLAVSSPEDPAHWTEVFLTLLAEHRALADLRFDAQTQVLDKPRLTAGAPRLPK